MTTAIVFPGQGSQTVGMLGDIAQHFKEVKETFSEASAVLGYDLWQLTQQGPEEKLNSTTYTQPALLAASYAIWRIIQITSPTIQPIMLAGHSLGEYTALVCAQALSFRDAITLVAARGQYMQNAVTEGVGAMAALIGLEEEAVTTICQSATRSPNEMVAPANFNSIGQIVISGHKKAVEHAMTLAKEAGAKMTILLPVSIPSHCQLMKPAASALEKMLETITIHIPHLQVIKNIDAQPYDTPQSIRIGLVKQLYMPVHWVETIRVFIQSGITHIIECGPGNILTNLNKRIDKNLNLITTKEIMNL